MIEALVTIALAILVLRVLFAPPGYTRGTNYNGPPTEDDLARQPKRFPPPPPPRKYISLLVIALLCAPTQAQEHHFSAVGKLNDHTEIKEPLRPTSRLDFLADDGTTRLRWYWLGTVSSDLHDERNWVREPWTSIVPTQADALLQASNVILSGGDLIYLRSIVHESVPSYELSYWSAVRVGGIPAPKPPVVAVDPSPGLVIYGLKFPGGLREREQKWKTAAEQVQFAHPDIGYVNIALVDRHYKTGSIKQLQIDSLHGYAIRPDWGGSGQIVLLEFDKRESGLAE